MHFRQHSKQYSRINATVEHLQSLSCLIEMEARGMWPQPVALFQLRGTRFWVAIREGPLKTIENPDGTRYRVVEPQILWFRKAKKKKKLKQLKKQKSRTLVPAFKTLPFIEVLDRGNLIKPDYYTELLFHLDLLVS